MTATEPGIEVHVRDGDETLTIKPYSVFATLRDDDPPHVVTVESSTRARTLHLSPSEAIAYGRALIAAGHEARDRTVDGSR